MTTIFETVKAPSNSKAGRKPLPNPFLCPEVFPTDEGDARSVLVEEGLGSTEANRLIRQARQAAKALGLTARVQAEESAEGVQLLFWTVPQVTRRK